MDEFKKRIDSFALAALPVFIQEGKRNTTFELSDIAIATRAYDFAHQMELARRNFWDKQDEMANNIPGFEPMD